MNWDAVILADGNQDASIVSHVDALFAQQRRTWDALRVGEAALATVRTRRLTDQRSEIIVQCNPGRSRSTQARVDPASVACRPCFLCPPHLPAEERGIAFGSLVLLPNPFPVLPRHCTVASREHQPQRLRGQLDNMLTLARAIGPEMVVFYNGPQCGASAPDHLHFQVCQAAGVPLLSEVRVAPGDRTTHHGFGRSVLVAADDDSAAIRHFVQQTLHVMSRQATLPDGHPDPEPMLNIMVLYRDPDYLCLVVPRSAHRPSCYFDHGPARLAISPATLEMAGVLVVTEPNQFDRVDTVRARSIYEEVSLLPDRFATLAEAVLPSSK